MLRRIVEHCPELRYKLSTNQDGDLCAGGFPCGKELEIVFECELFEDSEPTGYLYQVFKCGHSREIKRETWESRDASSRNLLWDRLLPFQQLSVEFAEKAGIRCLLQHDMGLGKTIIALSTLRENADKMLPCIIACQPGDIFRWKAEADNWLGYNQSTDFNAISLIPQIYMFPKQKLSPLSQVTIIPWTRLGDPDLLVQLERMNYRSLIVDESQMYKSEDSARTRHIQKLIRLCGKQNGGQPPILFLSGTPILNNIGEFFPTLNALDPQWIPQRRTLESMCLTTNRGKALSIAPWWREKFFTRTSKYVMRMTKEEAHIPLPKIQWNSQWFHPSEWNSNTQFIQEYNKVLDELAKVINGAHPTASMIIGFMSQLRRLTGLMKVLSAAEFINHFLENTDPSEKLCVGVHHIDVRKWLCILLEKWHPLSMSDEPAEEKDRIENEFRNGNRLLIASILSAGQGRNLQFCKNAIILERQWNRERERQFAARFHRILCDKDGRVRTVFTDADTVNIDYLQAFGSFDEYFDELVKLKGVIYDSVDPDVEEMPEEDFILELARKVIQKRMKYVGA